MGLFGDWEVPLYYSTILEEHAIVRAQSGLFDISHMGKFYFEGPSATCFLEGLLPRRVAPMTFGQALYMPLLNDRGGFVDDIILYRISEDRYFMIVNAGNAEKDYEWIRSKVPAGVTFRDDSEKALIALQGPKTAEILDRLVPGQNFSSLKYYSFKLWQDGMVARTGYTGEDGFEIMANAAEISKLWDRLVSEGVRPVGFGARDTLRLEAGMLLYGHDMNEDVTPLEAGVSWALNLDKENFIGRDALIAQKKDGVKKSFVGFEMIDRGIPRQDHEIAKDGKVVGKVTSGTFSPTFKNNIGLGYVPAELAQPGTEIEIRIRDKFLKAKIVKIPFYKRKR